MDTPSIEDFLSQTELVVSEETFGDGDDAIDVELRYVDRKELDAMRRECMKVVNGRDGRREEIDVEKWRKYLRDRCLVGWKRLTYGKLLRLCNRKQALANGLATTAVPFTPQNALAFLAAARGRVGDDVLNFEDWVWTRITSLAQQRVQQEDAEKKV